MCLPHQLPSHYPTPTFIYSQDTATALGLPFFLFSICTHCQLTFNFKYSICRILLLTHSQHQTQAHLYFLSPDSRSHKTNYCQT